MNLPKISFIFPVYKEGKVVKNIKKIYEQNYPENLLEFIIAVDSPKEEFLKELNSIGDLKNVKIIISKERRGKVTATNEAVQHATGDILIFIDGDVEIVKIDLKNIVEKLTKEVDVITAYRYVRRENLIGKLQHLEYLVFYDITLPLLNIYKAAIFIEGSGFATRMDVWKKLNGYKRMIIEDFDFGFRSYLNGYKIILSRDLIIELDPLPSFRKFIDQRKRWYYGGVEAFFEYERSLILFIAKHIIFVLPIILFHPIVLFSLILFTVPIHNFYYIIENFYTYAMSNISPGILFLLDPFKLLNILTFLYSFFVYTLIMIIFLTLFIYIKRKRIENPLNIILFLHIYQNLSFFIAIYVLVYYVIFERPPKFNWKL